MKRHGATMDAYYQVKGGVLRDHSHVTFWKTHRKTSLPCRHHSRKMFWASIGRWRRLPEDSEGQALHSLWTCVGAEEPASFRQGVCGFGPRLWSLSVPVTFEQFHCEASRRWRGRGVFVSLLGHSSWICGLLYFLSCGKFPLLFLQLWSLHWSLLSLALIGCVGPFYLLSFFSLHPYFSAFVFTRVLTLSMVRSSFFFLNFQLITD